MRKNICARDFSHGRVLGTLNLYMMTALTEYVSEIQISYHPTKRKEVVISTSADAFEELKEWFPVDTISLQERFMVLYLNRANKVLGAFLASLGGITGTVADPRLIMSVALKTAAVGIVLAHNHPSGNLKPSRADELLTRRIQEAGNLLDIQLVDHIIISRNGYLSLADEGLL